MIANLQRDFNDICVRSFIPSGAPFLSRARCDPLAGRRRVRGLGARRARPGGSLNSCAGVTPRDDPIERNQWAQAERSIFGDRH